MTAFRKSFLIFLITINIMKSLTQDSHQFEMCRVTKTGTEYIGKISETKSGHTCEYWDSTNRKNVDKITDNDFPDGKQRTARNFCRNPTNSSDGPWCYVSVDSDEKENCTVPLCTGEGNCRSTGLGMEYTGGIQKSAYDNECLQWAATVKKMVDIDKMLPEGNVMLAGKSCRNPTGDESGPWCYVLSGETIGELEKEEESWIKEPCNIPTCFNMQFITVIRNEAETNLQNYYTHFTSIDEETEELSFSLLLWNPENWKDGEVKLAVSLVATPATGEQLRNWDVGFEVILRNVKSGVTGSKDEDESWQDLPGLISGTRWANLKLTWDNGFIALTAQNKEKPYFIHEIKQMENGLLSLGNEKIKYISVMGTTAFWNFSQNPSHCQEHITTSLKISRFLLLSAESLNKYLGFHLRSWGNCNMIFKISPPRLYPRVQLTVDESGKTAITLYESFNESKVLASTMLSSRLIYWKWIEFSISISGHRFHMLLTTKKGLETIFDVNNVIFQGIKWFGFGSTSTAHWTFFCKTAIQEYEAMPPECSVSNSDIEYEGHLWITKTGLPCIPWVAYKNELKQNEFPDGSAAAALNYCRNPTAENGGTYCYGINSTVDIKIVKESCGLRKCKFKDCRIAGTANDFMGQVATTISGRGCQAWTSNSPHMVDKILLNDDLYPERSVQTASNYCRDPSYNVAGPWCYTVDPKVKIDLCDIPDCYKPTSCTVIVTMATNKKVFLVPNWRAHGLPLWIKMWNPNVSTALVVNIHPMDKGYKYQLILGDDDNDKIKLYYVSESGEETLLRQKTSPHFLSSGRWVGLTIGLQNNEIDLSYEDTISPFFIWKKDKQLPEINAMYFSYEAKSEDDLGSLGVNFPCDVCQTEICHKELSHYAVYYPMNIWLENTSILVKNLTFHAKGTGVLTINFYTLPNKFPTGKLYIDEGSFKDLMEFQMVRTRFIDRIMLKHKGSSALVKDYWSEVTITFEEKEGQLFLNDSLFMKWEYPNIPLFYYFSIQCTEEIIWVVNCPPPILDGSPVNGGWSPWSTWECSATCGGGRGTRTRNCTNPEPTMFGKTCEGPSKEIGSCNVSPCGEITISTINLIRDHLAQRANNIEKDEKQEIILECNQPILEQIILESPTSLFHWNKDGVKLSSDIKLNEIDHEKFKLVIKEGNVSDSGVYACVVAKLGEEEEVVDVFALIVKSKQFTIVRRAGQRLALRAHSILLNNVYSNLRLTWFLNNNSYKEYDITDLRLIDEEIIQPLAMNHTGEWSCVIYQDQLRLIWTTSWYNLQVKRKANWATYLLEEDLFKGKLGTNEITIYLIVAVLFIFAVSTSAFCVIFIIRLQRSFTKPIDKGVTQ